MPQNESLEHTVWMDKQYFLIVKAKNTFDFLQIAFFANPSWNIKMISLECLFHLRKTSHSLVADEMSYAEVWNETSVYKLWFLG